MKLSNLALLTLFLASLGTAPRSLQAAQIQAQPGRLSGHVPVPVAAGLQPIAPLSSDKRLRLAVGLPVRNPAALSKLLEDLYDPSSPRYRQFLTAEDFAAQFGPTEENYQAVISFFQSHGFTIAGTQPNRMILDVTGSVGDIERTFQLKINAYNHPAEPRTFFAPDADPVVEVGLPILDISGLSDFVLPRPASLVFDPHSTPADARPQNGTGPSGSYRGTDFRTAYAPGIPSTLNGAGQIVGLVQFDGYNASDIATYLSLAGLPGVPLINVLLDDISGAAGPDNIEVALDIEMCNSMAPGLSAILVYEGQSGNDILGRIASDNVAKQISASWTFGINASTEQIFQQFAAQGQAYFNASGDSDAYAGAVSTPCDDPFVISVGGTILTTGAGSTYTSERVWNRNNGIGTGGGISTTYPIPSYQQGMNFTASHGSSAMRNLPDVAMIAENVFIVYGGGSQGFVGGTSVASPLWAAFMALVNQQAAARAKPPIGFLNPAIYSLGTNAGYSLAFHDIQTGNNTNSSSPTLFPAVPGYDLCTGWGTPTGTNLINALAPRLNSRVITNLSTLLVAESCSNSVIDPGEIVTINVALQNIGGIDTTNLIATLQASGGVLLPSVSQNYGALAGGGAVVTQSFSFTASGSCGSVLTATFSLQDGASSLGSFSVAFQMGVPIVSFTQNFDSLTPPALPSGWTTSHSGSVFNWITTAGRRDSLPYSAFIAESTNPGIAELLSPPIAISSSSAKLSFRNFYNAETDAAVATKAYDGGVLEIKIGAGAFADILAAGGSFASGGYNKTIDPTDDNPLDGRQCWSGISAGFITTLVNLPAAAAGQSIQLKWRFATDTFNAYGTNGWYIDSISIRDGYTCCSASAPAIVTQPTNQTTAIGSNATFIVSASGTAPLGYQWTFNGTNLSGATDSSLLLTSVQPSQAGPYAVVITNSIGSVTSAVATLRVLVAPTINLGSPGVTSSNVSLSLNSINGLNYTLQFKNALSDANWTPILPPIVGNGAAIVLQDTNPPAAPTRFYRVVVN